MSIRFQADDESLRPMGRATSGVIGMRFSEGDELLAMDVVQPTSDRKSWSPPTAATPSGPRSTSIRSRAEAARACSRRVSSPPAVGWSARVAVRPEDEIFAITSDGGVIRTKAAEVRRAQRQTMGVRLMNLPEGVNLVALARNADEPDEQE